MRKLFFTIAGLFFCLLTSAQSITPFVLNSSGGTAKTNNNKVYLDWSVGEMTLVNTMVSPNYKGLIIITNGFLQPPKDDGEGDEDMYYTEFLKPEASSPSLRVYPNPTSTYVTIDIPMKEAGKVKLTLLNSMGELVFQKEVSGHGNINERISMAGYSQGTYLLRVQMGSPGTRATELTYKIFKAN